MSRTLSIGYRLNFVGNNKREVNNDIDKRLTVNILTFTNETLDCFLFNAIILT